MPGLSQAAVYRHGYQTIKLLMVTYLGVALASKQFCKKFHLNKVNMLSNELEQMSDVAKTQPHALTHCLIGKWNYGVRTNNFSPECLWQLEETVTSQLIPAVTHCTPSGVIERNVFALPNRLGLSNPTSLHSEYANLKRVQAPLHDLIFKQVMNLGNANRQKKSIKSIVQRENQ